VAEEEATSEAIHAAAHPGRRAAEADEAEAGNGGGEAGEPGADVATEEVPA
jgi:hypothetical protein